MITTAKLRTFGANVDEGVARCVNNEPFYLKMVGKAIDETAAKLPLLKEAVNAGNLDVAFEICHGLKGILGNLSLTPLFAIAGEMSDLLKNHQEADYPAYYERLEARFNELQQLISD